MHFAAIPLHQLTELPFLSAHDFNIFFWGIKKDPYDAHRPHRHGFHELLFFFEGSGTHEIDGVIYPVEAPCVFFVKAGQVHLVTGNTHLDGCSLLFEHHFLSGLTSRFISGAAQNFTAAWQALPYCPFGKPEFEKTRNMLHEIYETFLQPRPANYLPLVTRLELLTLQLYRMLPEKSSSRCTERRHEVFLQLVEQHWEKRPGISGYADMLNITPGYLNKIAKQYLGKTASDIISGKYITEAKRLLSYTQKSIKEIAYDLNFEDPAYFIRFFKKNTGTTPRDYRRGQNSRDSSCF